MAPPRLPLLFSDATYALAYCVLSAVRLLHMPTHAHRVNALTAAAASRSAMAFTSAASVMSAAAAAAIMTLAPFHVCRQLLLPLLLRLLHCSIIRPAASTS